eukprot:gene20759-27579_t
MIKTSTKLATSTRCTPCVVPRGITSRIVDVAIPRSSVIVEAKKIATKTNTSAPASKGFGKVATAPTKPEEGCPCGSMKFYKDCCQTYHAGSLPADIPAMLQARFFATCRRIMQLPSPHPTNEEEDSFLLNTDQRADKDRVELKRTYVASCEKYDYANLKVLEVEQEEGSSKGTVTFTYSSNKV